MARGRIYKHPTKPLHINVPLDLHASLMEFAELSGTPASRFITLMLVENKPVIDELIASLRQVQAGVVNPLDGISRMLTAKLNEAASVQSEVQQLSSREDSRA